MLTREQVIEAVRAGRRSECMDGRDYARLVEFFPLDQWEVFGMEIEEEAALSRVITLEFNRDNVLVQLAKDVGFSFEKALNKRGISSGWMHEVVKMWMWILEDELYDKADELYPQYGLPFFKAVAVKYGFPNPIGEDSGTEGKYEG